MDGVHWHRAAATAAAAHSSLYGAQGQLGAQGRLHTNTRDFPLLLPPIAGLFPGVMKDIEGEMNSLRLDPDESISLGLTMALIGNLVTTVGLNVQRYVHTKQADSDMPYTSSRVWWIGIVLMLLGEVGNFAAYGFAPATLVAPMGAATVIANAVCSSIFLGERFRRRDFLGTALIVIGGIGLVYFSPHEEKQLGVATLLAYIFSDIFFMYSGVLVLVLVALFSLPQQRGSRSLVADLSVCAILGSWTVMSTKGLSVSVRMTLMGEEDAFRSWITYVLLAVLVCTAIFQVRYLNRAMANFGTSQVVPVYFVLFTLASIMGGIVMYREFESMGANSVVSFFSSILLTFIGVYLLTSDREYEAHGGAGAPPDFEGEEGGMARLHGVALGGGFGLGIGLLLTPFCFPLFMCCAVFSGVGVGGVAAALPRARKAEGGPAGYDPYSYAGGYGSTLVNSMDP